LLNGITKLVYKLKILLIVSKSRKQLHKIVLYDNPKKKMRAKINNLRKDVNTVKCIGSNDRKFDLIESIYKFDVEPNLNLFQEGFGIELIPHVLSSTSCFDSKEVDVNIASLISEYLKIVGENKHNVYQFNLI